ncbi:MAG: hypothetical protein JNK65_00045 [Deltaproteobacteria bacterium]|nr:hypothetical protein [Deltaproteobacteria bacterium]
MAKMSLKEKLNVEDLYNQFLGMDQQQRLITLGGIAFVLILLIVIPVSCASSKISKSEKNIMNHEKNMDELVSRIKDYQAVQEKVKAVEGQWAGRSKVSLSTALESLSQQSGLDKNIDSIKAQPPSAGEKDILEEHVAAVRLSRAPLPQAIDFLYKIESYPQAGFKVKKLQIKPRYDSRQLFDLNFEVSTFALKEGAGN